MKLTTAILLGVILLMLPITGQARAFARWHTSMGSFTAELYDEIVPITANNFIDLTNSGFYNDLIFHRVVAGFVIQDGCPFGTGYGGPGYTIPDEISPLLLHDQAGILAMARTSAPNSAGSQYYITLAPTPHLNGNYAIFGKVIEGLDTVMAIGLVPVDASSRPLTPVNIYQLRMLDLHIVNSFPDPQETIVAAAGEPLMFIIEATSQAAQISYNWFVDEVLQAGQSDFVFETAISEAGDHTVRCNIASTDSITHDISWAVQIPTSIEESQIPSIESFSLSCYPNPFNNQLEIEYSLKQSSEVEVHIHNIRGQKVRSFQLGSKSMGTWKITWDTMDDKGQSCPSGLYFIRLQTSGASRLGKSLLIK